MHHQAKRFLMYYFINQFYTIKNIDNYTSIKLDKITPLYAFFFRTTYQLF